MRKGKIHDKIFAILFHFPSFCLYTVFLILPLVASFFIALLKWNGVGDSVFVGLDNFLDIFVRDRYFKKIIANTLISMGAGVFIQLPLALILAYMVYRVKKGFRFFQTSYFVPVVISATVIGLMFSLFFNPTFGPINTFLKAVGMEKYIKNWLSDPDIVLLQDDHHFFPSYYAGTVIREDALIKYPELKDILMLMDHLISDEEMAEMNDQVESFKRNEQEVAKEFLEKKGLLEVKHHE